MDIQKEAIFTNGSTSKTQILTENTVNIPSECLVWGTLNGDDTNPPMPTEGEQLIAITQNALTTADELGKGILITIAPNDSMQKNNAKLVLNGDYYDAERINDVINQLTNGGNAMHLFMALSTVERVKAKNIKKSALLLNWDSNVADSMCYLNKILHCCFEDSEDEGVKWGWRTTDSWFCYNNAGFTKSNLRIEGGSCRFIGNHLDGMYDLINISGYDASHKNGLVQIVHNRMINSNVEKPRFCMSVDFADNMIISGNVFDGYNEPVPINITENCSNCVTTNNLENQ